MSNTLQDAFTLANQYINNNRLVDAESILKNILTQHPKHHGAMNSLGIIAFKSGKLPLAIQMVINAVRINKNIGLYHRNLSELFRLNKQTDQAILAGKNATDLMPDDATAFYNLGLAYASNNQPEDAIVCYKIATSLSPSYVEAWNNMGNLYAEQGEMIDARACFYQAIQANPKAIDAHYNLSALKTFVDDDEQYELLKSLDNEADSLPTDAQIQLQFTLGKAHEDTKNYTAALTAYTKGNALYRAQYHYDENADIQNHHHIEQVYNSAFIQRFKNVGSNDKSAIFIIGMPRSGTTLVEQILSSHSAIHGAGEISALSQVMNAFSAPESLFYPTKLQEEDFAKLGILYSEKIKSLTNDANKQFICNKTPNNYLHLGLIKLMLPNAKIIHVLRDPMDSCFSCYAKLFSENVNFTYSQEELGRYYARYRELMKYWENALPENSIYTIHYENLIANLETETKNLLNYVGVNFEEACLDFQNTQRKVNTASIAQVRKPLYTSSIARWENFSEGLQPLLDIVKNYR
jgi:tetratricopeptide (TPR) repeat protein